jgi:hypothetical protein
MTPDRTLVQFRERSFLDILDLALIVIRNRPGPLVIAACAGIAPFFLLNYLLAGQLTHQWHYWALVLFMEAPWATAPLTIVMGGLMFGRHSSVSRVVTHLAAALPALVLTQLILRGLLTVTLVLIPLIPNRLRFVDEVILLEKSGGFKAMRRCGQLRGNRPGDTFGQWIGMILLGGVFTLCFWVGSGAIFSALVRSELTWDRPAATTASLLRLQLGAWIAIAFFAVARFLLYIDQRVRLEGWELKLRLEGMGRRLEEARR